MLVAGNDTGAPDVTYPLNASGWHAISIGLLRESHEGGVSVQVRLSDDPAFTVLSLPEGPARIEDVYWKTADLTGRRIILGQLGAQIGVVGQPGAYQATKARIASIKLEPLSEDAAAWLQADRRRTETKRLFAHNDAHGFHFSFRPTTPEEIYREVECYRDTDVSRLYWECGGGDVACFFGTVGRLPTADDVGEFDRLGDRLHAESWRVFRDSGLDPFKLALDHAHSLGLEFHASYRTAGFFFPPPDLDHWTRGGFYDQHPELRAVSRNGSQAPRISYAYPEARRYVVSFLRDVARYPVDGVCLLFNRRPPLVDYEPPLVEGFAAEYGQDPRQLDEQDPRWLEYRCRALTQFMREVRQAMDEVARERGHGKRIAVSAVVANPVENLLYAMDPKSWIEEGLIDTLIPYTSAARLLSSAEAWTDAKQVDYWVSLTRGTACKLALNIMPRYQSPEDFRRKAAMLYGAGVENLFFWDCAGRANYTDQIAWNALRRLGHQDEIDAWMRAGQPSLAEPSQTLRVFGGYNLEYQTPG
jgi:uncharacterized lipoprotein YddW (UPF0748 family)